MDGVGVVAAGDIEDEVAAEIRFAGGSGAEAVSFIGLEDVEGRAIGVGIDGDRGDAKLAAGAQDAEGDFSTIGDENFAKHRKTGYSVQGTGYRAAGQLGAGVGSR